MRVIICCGTNGRAVVFGDCNGEPEVGQPVTLQNARMVLYWPKECGGLFGLAANGPKTGLRLSESVSQTSTEVVRQWLTVDSDAGVKLAEWPAV